MPRLRKLWRYFVCFLNRYNVRDSLAAEDEQWENWRKEINADVERAHRKTEKRQPLTEEMQAKLNRVLLSYAMHDTAVGCVISRSASSVFS
jgi:hypothetical protein